MTTIATWWKGAAAALGLCAVVAACGVSTGGGSALPTEGVTDAMLAAPPEGEWLSYGRDLGEQRFSPLTQIDAGNVGELGLAWYADLDTARGQEATPLMHDGVLYVSTAWSKVLAFDAKTGALKWSYDPEVPRETLAVACCDAVNRGVALYGDKVYVATLDGDLVALNQRDGTVAWRKQVVPERKNYTITGAPRIAHGKVLIGSGGAEYRARGFIAAYDWATGEEAWRFHTVPGNPADGFENDAMKTAADTWSGEWWTLGGGGTVWDSITYDPETNLVLFGTGNAEPWNPAGNGRLVAGKSGEDNLYTSSIVAVDADTGAYRWHFQQTPEDRWDYDSNSQITLADLTIDGTRRHVALHVPKNGFVYVLDAKTGEFLSATGWTPQNWTSGIDPVTGQPRINPEARYEVTGKPFVLMPGAMGAHSWHPMSFSPATGLVYFPANVTASLFVADEDWEPSDMGFQTALDLSSNAKPANLASKDEAVPPTTGALVAWDPVAKKEAWRVRFSGRGNGGTLATAGNLVFQGDASEQLVAYSADTGARLWSFPARNGIVAAPMSYAIDGEQYIAVLAGKSLRPARNGRLLVFKIGGSAALPEQPLAEVAPLDPPPFTGTEAQASEGGLLFGRYCAICHGKAAVSGSANPDLRHSGAINSAEAIEAIVIDGALAHNGMASFKTAITPQGAEAIRQYLIKRANDDKALERRAAKVADRRTGRKGEAVL